MDRVSKARTHLAPVVRMATSLGAAIRAAFDEQTLRPLGPGIVALAFMPFLVPLVRLELNEPLFGDTAVYQYTGWCILHGQRLYRDFGMADGPFIHYLHAAIQIFSGTTDRGFRKCDLILQVIGSGAIGALLAPVSGLPRRGRWAGTLAWAAMAAAVWLSWYFALSWQDTTQREAYYALFGSAGMVAVYTSHRWTGRGAWVAIFVGAFLTTTQAFGKPTGIVYPAMGALGVVMPRTASAEPWRFRVQAFLAGACACVFAVLLALVVSGSVRGYLFWCWKIPYVGNLYLFRVDWLRLFLVGWESFRMMAVASLVVGVGAIALQLLPARALGFALAPALLFLAACLQARGYRYHLIPVTATFHLFLLVVLSSLWETRSDGDGPGGRGSAALLAFFFLTYHCFDSIQGSPFRWTGDKTKWKTPMNHYGDDERKAGRYIREHTAKQDYIFAYGADPHYVLLNAERRSASPFFHMFWLEAVDLLPQSEIKPGPKELEALTRLQTEVRDQTCSAVERVKPAAMAFDSLERANRICPSIGAVLKSAYDDAATFGAVHVYLRKGRESPAPTSVTDKGPR